MEVPAFISWSRGEIFFGRVASLFLPASFYDSVNQNITLHAVLHLPPSISLRPLGFSFSRSGQSKGSSIRNLSRMELVLSDAADCEFFVNSNRLRFEQLSHLGRFDLFDSSNRTVCFFSDSSILILPEKYIN